VIVAIVAASIDSAFPAEPYPLSVPGCYLWKLLTKTGTDNCPLANQQKYYDQILKSCPPEADYVWRIVLAFGAVPALFTMYFRNKMKETPRYTARVVGNIIFELFYFFK
jgi:hypothetical protein